MNGFTDIQDGLADLAELQAQANSMYTPEIWFSSVFDGITLPIKTDTHYRPYLSGVDATTGSEFPYDLPGRHIDDIGATGLEDSFNTHIYANCQDRPGCDNVPTDFVDISIQNKIGPSGGLEDILHIELKDTPHDIDCVLSTGATSSFSLDPYDDGDGSNRDTLSQWYMAYDLYQHLDNYSNYNLMFQTKAYDATNNPKHKWSIYLSEVYGEPCYQMAFEHEYQGDQNNRYYPSLDAVQAGTNPKPVRDAWTRIELFVINSEGDDGVIQMAQDGVIVQEWYGRNMDNTYVSEGVYDCSGDTDPLHAGSQRIFGQYGGVGFQEIANFEMRELPPTTSILFNRTFEDSPNGMNERIWCPE